MLPSRKKIFFLFLILPVSALIPVIITFIEKPLTVFPAKQEPLNSYSFCDASKAGNSEITDFLVSDKQIYFKYIIRKGDPYPYAGISIVLLDKHNAPLDLSRYSDCRITIYTSHPGYYRFYLKSNLPEFSDLMKYTNLRHLEKLVYLQKKTATCRIPIKEFVTPQWWYRENHINPGEIKKEDYKEIAVFDFQDVRTDTSLLNKEENTIIIDNLSFHKTYSWFYLILASGILLYYLILFSVPAVKKEQFREPKVDISRISYKKLELATYEDDDMKRIQLLIEEQYASPDFSIKTIQQETGLSSQRIALLIKNKFGSSFKQLLNSIRITEAKRLLVETDRNIKDIALNVGFNNISYFFQTFKIIEGISPREYRKQNSGS